MKIKLFSKEIKIIIPVLIILLSQNLSAQMHCRSILGGHLTALNEEGSLLGGIEGTMAPGVMMDSDDQDRVKLNGGMLIGALDFSISSKHSFYLEGGYKNWNNSELAQHNTGDSRHLGIRQVFYNYKRNDNDMRLGLQEMRMDDYFLLDERVLGGSFNRKSKAFDLNFRIGTVLENFARMGHFCGNKHIYSLIATDYTDNIGEKIGETNLAGLVINWDPHRAKIDKSKNDNEFSEISEFDSFNNLDNQQTEIISNIGFILYDEFGDIIENNKFYGGLMVDSKMPFNFTSRAGFVYQNMADNNSSAYIWKIGNQWNWNSGANTQIESAYMGLFEIDNGAIFQPLFSNLFMGEIMRLDAIDLPLVSGSIKHNFPGKLNFHTGIRTVQKIEDNETFEIDLEAGAKLFNHSKLTLILSKVQTEDLDKDIYMARTEVRVAF